MLGGALCQSGGAALPIVGLSDALPQARVERHLQKNIYPHLGCYCTREVNKIAMPGP